MYPFDQSKEKGEIPPHLGVGHPTSSGGLINAHVSYTYSVLPTLE